MRQTLQLLVFCMVIMPRSAEEAEDLSDKPLHLPLIEAMLRRQLEEFVNKNRTLVRQMVIESDWALARIDMSRNERRALWNALRGNKTSKTITAEDVELGKKYIKAAPDQEWMEVNISDWKLVSALGKLKNWDRLQVSVFANRMRKEYGEELLKNADYLNSMGGLICGFSGTDLRLLKRKVITKLSEAVLNNLYGCTKNQLKMLRLRLIESTIFGHPQVWRARDVKKLGHVLWSLDETELSMIRPHAFAGLNKETLKLMRNDVIRTITKEQFDHLSTETKVTYHELVGVVGGNVKEYKGGSITMDQSVVHWLIIALATHLLLGF